MQVTVHPVISQGNTIPVKIPQLIFAVEWMTFSDKEFGKSKLTKKVNKKSLNDANDIGGTNQLNAVHVKYIVFDQYNWVAKISVAFEKTRK